MLDKAARQRSFKLVMLVVLLVPKAETADSAAGVAEGGTFSRDQEEGEAQKPAGQPTMPIPSQDDMELELERLMEARSEQKEF